MWMILQVEVRTLKTPYLKIPIILFKENKTLNVCICLIFLTKYI